MSASILSFGSLLSRARGQKESHGRDWDQQELAELYRVRDRLVQSGLAVALENGLTDEGDPWAAFLQSPSGEVFVHIARIDGVVIVANVITQTTYRGSDFRAISDRMLENAPLVLPRNGDEATKVKVVMHPRSVFTAFVAAALVLSELARSVEPAAAGEVVTPATAAAAAAHAAETRQLFPHLFERVLARDAGVFSGFGTSSAVAASLVSAAVGAVLLSESGADDLGDAQPASHALPEREQPAEAGVPAPAPQPAESSRSTESLPVAEAAGAREVETQKPAKLVMAEPPAAAGAAEAPVEPAPEPKPTHEEMRRAETPLDLPRGSEKHTFDNPDLHKPMKIAGSGLPVEAAAASGSEGSQDRSAATPHEVHASVKSETTSKSEASVSPTQHAAVSDSIIVMKLSSVVGERLTTTNLTSADDIKAGEIAATAVMSAKGEKMSGDWYFYNGRDTGKEIVLANGSHDVVLVGEGQTTVRNFNFSEDHLLVDGSIEKTSWIQSIEVIDSKTVITSYSGAVVWLIDSHGLVA